jgi:hypothetical protein
MEINGQEQILSCEDDVSTYEQDYLWPDPVEQPLCTDKQSDVYVGLSDNSESLKRIEEGNVKQKKSMGEILLGGLQGLLTIFPFYARPAYAEEKQFVTNGNFSPYQQASEVPQLTGNTLSTKLITGPTTTSPRVGTPVKVTTRFPKGGLGPVGDSWRDGAVGAGLGCVLVSSYSDARLSPDDRIGGFIALLGNTIIDSMNGEQPEANPGEIMEEWEFVIQEHLDGSYTLEQAVYIADVQQSQQRTLTSGEAQRQAGGTSQGSGSSRGNSGRTTKSERERQAEREEAERDKKMRELPPQKKQPQQLDEEDIPCHWETFYGAEIDPETGATKRVTQNRHLICD